jgi:uncharacterized protein
MQALWFDLLERCRAYPSLLVAFSGGVDSTLVARVASEAVSGPILLAFCRTQLITTGEEEQARNLAKLLDLPFQVVELDALALPEVAQNRRERCYVCKLALFSHLCKLAAEKGLARVADGANADDLRFGHRPGNRASAELQIAQPLAEAGLDKKQVRALALQVGLPNHEQAARPCLATRFPYDTPLCPKQLLRVAEGEQFLVDLGCKEFRLRIHGDICRIEATVAERELIMAKSASIEKVLTALGWRFVTLDLGGLKSGCFDIP